MIDNVTRFIFRKTLSRIEKFRNIHKGETCYIFGDGPSIKWFDLGQFQDYPAICGNAIAFHKDFAKLNARYYLIVEPWLFCPSWMQRRQILRDYKIIADEFRSIIISNQDIQFFLHLSNYFSVSGANVNYVFRGLPKNINKTDELLMEFDLFGGSFHAELILAYYLGFSKIYLVGFDAWTIQPARNLHWYEYGEGILFEPTNFATDFLNILKSECEIYTISMDGDSQNVTNISYENYTGKPPTFKENFQLMEQRYLDILATCPGCRIFEDGNTTK